MGKDNMADEKACGVIIFKNENDTRKYVIGAFEMLYAKREDLPFKKHGTV